MHTVFDREQLEERLQGDQDLILEVVRMFIVDCPRKLEKLDQALSTGAGGTMEHLAHELKGTTGLLCAIPAYEAALGVEQIARWGDPGQAGPALERLRAECGVLIEVLNEFSAKGVA